MMKFTIATLAATLVAEKCGPAMPMVPLQYSCPVSSLKSAPMVGNWCWNTAQLCIELIFLSRLETQFFSMTCHRKIGKQKPVRTPHRSPGLAEVLLSSENWKVYVFSKGHVIVIVPLPINAKEKERLVLSFFALIKHVSYIFCFKYCQYYIILNHIAYFSFTDLPKSTSK